MIYLVPDDKPKTAADVDRFICAEIPDPVKNPKLHELGKTKMLHGPCQGFNPKCPCMLNKRNRCEKDYPKKYQEFTTMSEQGFISYRRRSRDQGGFTTTKKVLGEEKELGNIWVVPYNPFLLMKYKCHINTEVCASSKSLKYLFGYIYKGSDKTTLKVKEKIPSKDDDVNQGRNEIEEFETGRHMDSTQSCHRIFGFKMHVMKPPVMKLQFHLENEQVVPFDEDANVQDLLQRHEETQLTAFFKRNREHTDARDLLYADLPSYFTWNGKEKEWKPRVQKRTVGQDGPMSNTIGRIPIVALGHFTREKFFFRQLLYHVKGKNYNFME